MLLLLLHLLKNYHLSNKKIYCLEIKTNHLKSNKEFLKNHSSQNSVKHLSNNHHNLRTLLKLLNNNLPNLVIYWICMVEIIINLKTKINGKPTRINQAILINGIKTNHKHLIIRTNFRDNNHKNKTTNLVLLRPQQSKERCMIREYAILNNSQ